jgi:sec-independent protein translocase protein TatB
MVGAPLAALDNPVDLVVLLVFAFLLFGKQLPEVARSLGKGIRELKESTNFSEVTEALNSANEVRSIATPTNIARAAVPGVAALQDTVDAAKELANPFAAVSETEAGAAEPAADESAAQAPSAVPAQVAAPVAPPDAG